ncbi:MAG: hemolysin family protein [Candidatus Nanopelagicales bacterium]
MLEPAGHPHRRASVTDRGTTGEEGTLGALWVFGLLITLILVAGLFSAAEMALVSMRPGQLSALALRGERGRRAANLAAEPNRFLAAVQIGSTVAGFISAAFGAALLAEPLVPGLVALGLGPDPAESLAVLGTTLVITFLALVFAELVPRRLAMQKPEPVALALGPIVDRFARLMRPVIALLGWTTNVVVALLGGDPKSGRDEISMSELRELVAQHGEIGEHERRIFADLFHAGERRLGEVMRPRPEVDFLAAEMSLHEARRIALAHPHSRYPVFAETPDQVIGFVHVRDLVGAYQAPGLTVADVIRPPVLLPASKLVLAALAELQAIGGQFAVVVDEFGGTAGIVTLEDLVEQLIGDIRDEYDQPVMATGRPPLTGPMSVGSFARLTGRHLPPGPYETVGGFIIERLGRLACVGDEVAMPEVGITLVVASLEGRRIGDITLRMPTDGAPAE